MLHFLRNNFGVTLFLGRVPLGVTKLIWVECVETGASSEELPRLFSTWRHHIILSHVFGVEGDLSKVCTWSEELNIRRILKFNQVVTGWLKSKWEFFYLISTEVLFGQFVHKVHVVGLHKTDVWVLENVAELNGLEDLSEISDDFGLILSVEEQTENSDRPLLQF